MIVGQQTAQYSDRDFKKVDVFVFRKNKFIANPLPAFFKFWKNIDNLKCKTE